MQIDWLIPSRYAEVSGDGTVSVLGGGVDTLLVSPLKLPTQLGIFLAMRVAAPAYEWCEEGHVLSISITDPGNEELIEVEVPLAIPEAAAVTDSSRELGMLLPSPCRFQATGFGRYAFTVCLNGGIQRIVYLQVASSG
jgi:hypothetical protein